MTAQRRLTKEFETEAALKRKAALASSEWRDGWPVICVGIIGMMLQSLHLGPLTVLMKPLGDVFGWGRSQISAGQMILTLLLFALSPIVGVAIPRFGIKKIVLVAIIIQPIGFVMLGLSTGNIWNWYLGWTVLGFGIVGLGPLLWTTAITRIFFRNRGFALSLSLSGIGISTFASPLVTAYALEAFNWRAPFFILAGFSSVIAFPILWWLMNKRPVFGASPTPRKAATIAAHEQDSRFVKMLGEVRVWQLMLASMLIAAAVGTLMTHLQAIMRDSGATATQAAAYFSALGPSLIVGRLGAGVLLDRLPPRIVAAALFLLPAITCVLLLGYDGSAAYGVVCCIIFGLSYGAETDVLAYLTSRYFNLRAYPVVYSLVCSMYALGYGVASVLGGAIFDHFGSYERMLYGLMACALVAVLMILTMGRPLPREEEAPRI